MPLKKDETGKRWVEMNIIVPGTPEQVWQAIATGPGNAAWFTKTTIEEHVGGQLRFDFGPNGASPGQVTTWEPPHRFGYVERDWAEGAPAVATEITITARSGDRSVIRMVHSLFSSTDAWDDQLEGFEGGWPAFFEVLRVYLTHFAGQRATSFVVVETVTDDQMSVWKRLLDALNLAGANVGDRRTTSSPAPQLSGVIEHVRQDGRQRVVTIRLDAPLPGVALVGTYDAGGSVNASVSLYFYGDRADAVAAANESLWKDWLKEELAAAHRS